MSSQVGPGFITIGDTTQFPKSSNENVYFHGSINFSELQGRMVNLVI
jgi:hypothetical protein